MQVDHLVYDIVLGEAIEMVVETVTFWHRLLNPSNAGPETFRARHIIRLLWVPYIFASWDTVAL